MTRIVVALLLLAAGAVALTARPAGSRSRLGALSQRQPVLPTWARVYRWRAGGRTPVVGAVSGAAVAGLAAGGPVAAIFGGTYAWLAVRAWANRRATRSTEHGAVVVDDLVTGLAADLRAGLAPMTALEWGIRTVGASGWPADGGHPRPGLTTHGIFAAHRGTAHGGRNRDLRPDGDHGHRFDRDHGLRPDRDHDRDRGHGRRDRARASDGPYRAAAGPFAPALAAATAGGDVPAALRELELPGGQGALTRLAAAWEVADSSGAPLADVLDRLDVDLSALRRRRTRMRTETAAASATVRVLALLPLLGLGLGYALGADPLRILLHSVAGSASALMALGLQVTGLLWAERLASPPERQPP